MDKSYFQNWKRETEKQKAVINENFRAEFFDFGFADSELNEIQNVEI